MVALLDPQLNFIRVNRAYANADEKEPSFYPGKNHFDLFPNKENEEIFRRVVKTGEPHFANAAPFQYEEHPERGVSYWDWSLVPIKDVDRAVASLIFTLLNVTERIQAEAAVIESEEKYRTLFEESKDGIIMTTPAGKIQNANLACAEMLGFPSEKELLVLNSAYDLYQQPENRDAYVRTMMRQGFVKNYELDLKRTDGSPLVVSMSSTALQDEKGKIVSFRGIMHDMTAHRLLEQQLFESQKMEIVGQLAGGVAHDFNNFLTAIEGYIDLAAMELPADSVAAEDLKEARAASDRAAKLARQLLLFGHREHAEMVPVDLNQVVSDFMKVLGRLIGESYSVQVDLAEDLEPVNADTGHIDQVLMNLVINARDATPDGGAISISTRNILIDHKFELRTVEHKPGRYVCIKVRDWGTGIDHQTLPHIFEPFFSTKGRGKGTGLGLSVVYGIIKQHGGWIDVDSAPGAGSTFKLYLPATDILPEEAVSVTAAEKRSTGHGERILLVEDEDSIRALVKKMLTGNAYSVVDVPDAEQALAAYDEADGDFSLLFTDIVLPGQNGVTPADELCRRNPRLNILLASGYSDESDWKAIEIHGYRFLRKPYSLPELLRIIAELVQG